MSFLISHPEGYTFVSADEVPEDFVVKCYPESRIVDQTLPVEQWQSTIDHWAIDYDLPKKTIRGLFRYTEFKTFEEAVVKCNLLGLRCDKYDWLALPPSRAKNGGWCRHICSIPNYGSVLIPISRFDEEKVKIYKKRLGKDYDYYVKTHPHFLDPYSMRYV